MRLAPGERVGSYEILGHLGSGGMGEVYRARDVRLDRTVALKVVAPHIAGSADADLRARFEREARAIAALDDPHICSVYDVGERDGLLYLVMPCLEGQTLAARLATRRPLPLADVLRIGIEVASALERTHRARITHRDLKPANIMLTATGAKLLDFGLAKVLAPSTTSAAAGVTQLTTTPPVTAAGTLVGTVHYMAPEQVEGREADARSDVWAFGAVVYEMATGHRPFDGPSAASIIGAILRDRRRHCRRASRWFLACWTTSWRVVSRRIRTSAGRTLATSAANCDGLPIAAPRARTKELEAVPSGGAPHGGLA